ncbi:MAG TPA: aminomethyltransferase family protein [Terriglobia bacterium]|nr:aminomethyltransferase family protein [Terriglobia bacterium]
MANPFQSPLADSHISQGAILGEYHGALVPLRFSGAIAEHQKVRRWAGIFDFFFHAQFVVKGEDRARFLHRIVSQDIKSLSPGQGAYAMLLNAQGHILADFRVYCTTDYFLIDTDADLRDKAMQALARYIIGDRVQLESVEMFVLAIQGPRSRAFLEKALQAELPPLQEYDHVITTYSGMAVRVIRATSTGEDGYELWGGAKDSAGIWEALRAQASTDGVLCCGTEALESLRIEAGIARYGPDMGEDTLPLEVGLLTALSFNKGCYVGQEIVERARSRGHVNWKLAGLFIEAAVVPALGEKLISAGKEIGEITSACASPTWERTIALAFVRREVAEPGMKLALASGANAEVTALPFYKRPAASAKG